jgi:hypothetical protein
MVFTLSIPFPVRKILRYEWGPILGTDFLVGCNSMEFKVKIGFFMGVTVQFEVISNCYPTYTGKFILGIDSPETALAICPLC